MKTSLVITNSGVIAEAPWVDAGLNASDIFSSAEAFGSFTKAKAVVVTNKKKEKENRIHLHFFVRTRQNSWM